MALGVLNNISAIYAQNNLSNTQASLSKTLQQLSSGSRINSGADDAAGLSLANGLQASSTALSQSAKNASEGVDFLQVADGALSQVTSLLNRAVTLATEASNGTLNSSQVSAANSEFQKILTETDTINNNTEYNGIATFAKNSAFTVSAGSDKIDIGTTAASVATVTYGNKSFNLVNSGGSAPAAGTGYRITANTDTLSTVANAINQGLGATVATVQGNQLVFSGGAKISSGTQAISLGTSAAPLTTLNLASANDTIAPGSAGITISWGGGTPGSTLLTGAFASGGAGGTLTDLQNAINNNAALITAGVSAVATGSQIVLSGTGTGGMYQASATATESGSAVIPNLKDMVQIPTTGGTSSLTVGSAGDVLSVNTGNLQFTATGSTTPASINNFNAGQTGNLSSLAAQINTQFGSGKTIATISGNTLTITGGTLSQASGGNTTETEKANTASNQTVAIFTSDGTISQSYNNSASDLVQTSSSALSLAGTDLTSTTGAQAALVAINNAITSVAAARGTLGANINTLTAVGNVMTMQSTNTLAAENDVTATDYGQATSDMSKYQILSQTGIAALSQANQSQQLITKLLQ